MRRFFLIIPVAIIALIAVWYALWYSAASAEVARMEKTIAYHNQRVHTVNIATKLEYVRIHAIGFPFNTRVRIEKPALTYQFNEESYRAEMDYFELTPRDSAQGSYALTYPAIIHASYTKAPAATENYTAIVSPTFDVLLRAQGDSQQCSPFPGQAHCDDAKPDAPLISIATKLPAALTLTMQMGNQTQIAAFNPPSVPIPVYQTIPEDLHAPLEIFILMLRNALVLHSNQ